MKSVPERLKALRSAMQRAGCDAYIMPSSDPHASEYAPAHYTAWEYFSGFSVENSKLVVTADRAALWVDGRFFGAADAALAGTGIESIHMGTKGAPSVSDWIASALPEGGILGYTAENMCLLQLRKLENSLISTHVTMKAEHCDDAAWTEDRPVLPATEAWMLPVESAGMSTREKLEDFRSKMDGCSRAVVTKLDSIAWLLNLRAFDVENTPYAIAFCCVTSDSAILFIDRSRVPQNVAEELEHYGVMMQDYAALPSYLQAINTQETVMVDPDSLNAAIYNVLQGNPCCTILEKKDPIQMLKAVKNETELRATKAAHIRDAAAMVRFQIELEQRLDAGEPLREMDVDAILHKYRSSTEGFIEESFSTIAAYGANAAMMHYAPHPGVDAEIERKGFLLVDSGATYIDGTTDITRTYTVGPMSQAEKEMYTLTLRSHIDMAMAVWRAGMQGKQLDMIARQPFWHRMLDYRCGTGHSVSHVGAVHEGPHSLRYTNEVEFVPGMIITDEPGYYEDGVMGIRIENELVCVDAGESEYGHYLKFEPLMYVPINLEPVLVDELSQLELEWLNRYHSDVYEKVSPLLNDSEKAWLKTRCVPLH